MDLCMESSERNGACPSRDAPPECQAWWQLWRTSAFGTAAVWQWEHKTGFRDYKDHEVTRIEDAYQRGAEHVRLKSGKANVPMELFFHDMIQHDPITGNSRRIRRLGREGLLRRVRRVSRRALRFALEGGLQRRDFKRYEQMKKEIHSGIDRQEYSVANYYRKEGCWPSIARSGCFFAASMALVLLNAVWICIDANRDGRPGVDVPAHVWGMEYAFCALFTLELLVRFGAFERKRNCLKDAWFCFDSSLVFLMITETWLIPLTVLIFRAGDGASGPGDWVVLRVARVLRLTRLGRIARLLRAMPEVYMLLKGIATAIRSVLVTLLLLCALLLLFSVVFRQQAAEDEKLALIFPSVGTAMWLLLLHGTLLDGPMALLNQVGAVSHMLAALLLAFIFLSGFTVLNMLIGILTGVVSSVAENEKEQAAVQYLKSTLLDILECHDQDGDRAIQRDEFELLMRNPEVNIILTRFGVDVADLISLEDRLFEDKTAGTPWDDAEDDEHPPSLKVTLKGARKLRAADFGVVASGKSDPYCVCEILGRVGTQFRTETVHNSLDPVWNHVGHLKPFALGDSVRFTVMDLDWVKEDDFLGRAVLKSSEFFPNGWDQEIPLMLDGGGAAGFLRVKIEVLPEAVAKPSLSFAQFLEAVLRLRGGNRPTVHDIVELRGLLLDKFRQLHAHLGRTMECLAGGSSRRTSRQRPEEASPCWQADVGSPRIAPSVFAASSPVSASGMPLLPGVVPTAEAAAEAEPARPVLLRLEALDAGQQELRGELQGLRAQLSEVQRLLQAYAPAHT